MKRLIFIILLLLGMLCKYPTYADGNTKNNVKVLPKPIASCFADVIGKGADQKAADQLQCIQTIAFGVVNNQHIYDVTAYGMIGGLEIKKYLDSSDIFFICNHGTAGGGCITTKDSFVIWAHSNIRQSTGKKSAVNISDLPHKKRKLIVFEGCCTGDTDPNTGNLVVESVKVGYESALGFIPELQTDGSDLQLWATVFWAYLTKPVFPEWDCSAYKGPSDLTSAANWGALVIWSKYLSGHGFSEYKIEGNSSLVLYK